jgi:hypothetical protein
MLRNYFWGSTITISLPNKDPQSVGYMEKLATVDVRFIFLKNLNQTCTEWIFHVQFGF